MRNRFFSLLLLLAGIMMGQQLMAQGRIDLNAAKSTQECKDVTLDGFSASFSFSSIVSEEMNTEKGVFSIISMDNSIAAGNIGEPEVPVARKLIAVPFGATPEVTVKSYTVDEYSLADFGINRLFPHQASVSKSDDNPRFAYNEAAYTVRGYDESLPIAEVSVLGTMRGIQIGALQLNAVRYNAVANTIRVYNNIEVEVTFRNADIELTKRTLVNTYSPYFRTVYATLFNERAIRSVYDQHPDLWSVPVKVLVVANRMFEEVMQPWVTWKTEKGFYMDVNYTDQIGTTSAAIKSFIINKYNQGLAEGQTPTFLIIVGDNNKVPQSQMGSATSKVTDLYYYAVAGGSNDYFPDMFHSRFTCETVQEFQNVIDKSMMYEQYTMPDPSYLNNVLLIAGWDSNWNPRVGKPTIQYAMNYYYNAAHGFSNVYNFLQQPYSQPYANLNTGVNFVNYTAHGGDTEWSDPQFTVSNANTLTNNGKYFLAMGNCCLAANWGYSSKCLGEAMILGQNKGAYAYIGSPVETYWYEDYYFGVGATNTFNQMPTYEGSTMGVYDATFRDDFNSVSAIPFIGNIAVAYSHANNYTSSVSDQYYWEAYHVLGDGSVCPYHTNPIANTVSHMSTFPIGMNFYTVSADPGSYVGISKDGVLYGTGEIGVEGTADIPITPITSGGNVKIVVTHPQRQPYIATVPAASLNGPYISMDSYSPANAHVGDEAQLSITFKNLGTSATNGTTNVSLSCNDNALTILNGTNHFGTLAPNATVTVSGFRFSIAQGVADGTNFTVNFTATCGSNSWTGNFIITAGEAVLEFGEMVSSSAFIPGTNMTVRARFSNIGHYMATNAVGTISSTSQYVTIVNGTSQVGSIAPEGSATFVFQISISALCPQTAQIPLTFTVNADGGISALGTGTLRNSCNVIFDLADSYGDGWNNSYMTVSFSNGTPSQNVTISSGSSTTYTIEIGTSVDVSLTWHSGSQWDSECSFVIRYEDGDEILNCSSVSNCLPYSFVCNCGGDLPLMYTVTATANPVEGGTVTGGGNFFEGETCTLVATANNGYTFTSWTKNGTSVSTEAEYSFVVTSDATYVANFTEISSDYYWDVDIHAYPNTMSTIAIIKIDGEEQLSDMLEVGAFNDRECRGRAIATGEYYGLTGHYLVFLYLYGEDGDEMEFRLYDHATGEELELNCLTSLTFVTNGMVGNPANPFAIEFGNSATETTQVLSFAEGWSWISTYIEQDGIDGLTMLEEGLGNAGNQIKSQTNYVTNYGGFWMGMLNSITNESSYMVETNASCEVELTGEVADPTAHPITMSNGWNWIGYPVSERMSLTEAFSGFSPANGDEVKAQNGFSQYYYGIWIGGLNTIDPGMGLMYHSTTGGTLVYPVRSRDNALVENVTNAYNHWTNNVHAYPTNMTVTAVVELDEKELVSDNYELAAFADGEVRGSAKLMFVEPLNRYVAFLTIAGDGMSDLHFGLYNKETGEETFESADRLTYTADAMMGKLESPLVIRFRSTTGLNDLERNLQVYPNPVSSGESFSLSLPENCKARVEIVNALGMVLSNEITTKAMVSMKAPSAAGVYTLRITMEGSGTCSRKLVVK